MYESHYYTIHKVCPCKIGEEAVQKAIGIYQISNDISSFIDEMEKQRVFYYFHSLDWWRWHFEKTKLFTIKTGDDLDGDGVRVTTQWAKIMDKYDPLHNNEIMRWNRMVAIRNKSQADDFRK